MRKKRLLAGLLCVAYLLVLLCSASFVALYGHHDCTGADCPICAVLQTCEQVLRISGLAGVAAIVFVSVSLVALLAHRRNSCHALASTLVALKVELLN